MPPPLPVFAHATTSLTPGIARFDTPLTAWSKAAMLHLDCGNRQVTVVR